MIGHTICFAPKFGCGIIFACAKRFCMC
uniref:Uncharacterized protein n=1 Tax=Anguilla anguilla TaxID=7936 RepID=A0A0E9VDN2_ANGAN